MTKAEVIEQIVEKTGVEKPAVSAIVEGIMSSITGAMIEGDEVFLRGFGTFQLKKRAAKNGRNISKGTNVRIPEHMIPVFKPSKEFKEEVAKKVK